MIPPYRAVHLWDWPVRLAHWGFAVLLPLLWWTAEEGDIETHRRLGIAMLFLVVLRLAWGVVGSDPARFARFVKGPGAVLAYLRGQFPAAPGHNPLGGWSVAALLAVLSVQLGLGLFAQDEYGLVAGPLNHLVSYETAEMVTEWHETFFNAVLALVGLHLAAIAFYSVVRQDNLIGPMLTGQKEVEDDTAQPRMANWKTAALALTAGAALTAWIGTGAPPS